MYALTFATFLALTSGLELACDVAGNCGTEQMAMLQKLSRSGTESLVAQGIQKHSVTTNKTKRTTTTAAVKTPPTGTATAADVVQGQGKWKQ